jgi:hypothetical protein
MCKKKNKFKYFMASHSEVSSMGLYCRYKYNDLYLPSKFVGTLVTGKEGMHFVIKKKRLIKFRNYCKSHKKGLHT